MSPAGFYVWNNTTQTWVPRRAASSGGSGYIDRSTLVYGTYKPDATTTGTLPGTTLTPTYISSGGVMSESPAGGSGGRWNITTDGAVIENRDIYGGLVIMADNVTIRNCRIRNVVSAPVAGVWRACVDMTSTSSPPTNTVIRDCELYSSNVTELHLAVYGGTGVTVERCNIHTVVDGMRIWGAANTVQGNWIHDMVHYDPTPYTPTDGSHDDGIQLAPATYTGTQLIRGNWIDAHISGFNQNNNGPSCIMFPTQVRRVEVDKNWLDWGWFPINLGGTPNVNADVYITNNVMSPGWYTSGSGTTYHIVATTAWQAVYTLSGNTDRDTGGPIRVRNG